MSSSNTSLWNLLEIKGTRSFHLAAGGVCAATLLFSLVGTHVAAIETPSPGSTLFALLFAVSAVFPLAIYWHEKNRVEMREAALTIVWAVIVAFTLPPAVLILGRLGMPLQDQNLARMDAMLGVDVPAITVWSSHHQIGRMISATYPLLFLLAPIAVLVPAVTGKWVAARRFIVANIVAFLIGFTIFALVPAVGPWYGGHFQPDPGQNLCQAELLALRSPGFFVPHSPSIVCCPSFHVIWAILSAYALSSIRILRWPARLLSGLIVLSTMTTGWHYFTDVLAGFAVAWIAIRVAARLCVPQALPREAQLAG